MPHGDDAVPKEIVGTSKVTDLYGHWPTFHDASVESVLIERVGPTVTIRIGTCAMTYDGDMVRVPDQRATVVIGWQEISDLEIKGVDAEGWNWIEGLTFVFQG